MKRYFSLLALAALTVLVSCGDTEGGGGGKQIPPMEGRRFLVADFTHVKCPNCHLAAQSYAALPFGAKERMVMLSLHGNSSTLGFNRLSNTFGEAYMRSLSSDGSVGYPTWYFDFKMDMPLLGAGGINGISVPNVQVLMTVLESQNPTITALAVETAPTVNASDRIFVPVTGRFQKAGQWRIGCMLVEDVDGLPGEEEEVYHNVLRDHATPMLGGNDNNIKSTNPITIPGAGDFDMGTYMFEMDPEWNVEKCSFIIYIIDNTTNLVNNAIECPIGSTVEFPVPEE